MTEPTPQPVTGPGAEPVTRPAGTIVWFTGLPASGKSTLARRVQAHFTRTGRGSVLLDGDELRDILGVHSYAPEDRDRFYRALGALAALLAHQGVIVLVAATAPRREDRDRARAEAADGGFIEVWVKTTLPECEARDPKGLYAAARRGDAPALPGVGVAYEPPLSPEVIADGGLDDVAVAAVVAAAVPAADADRPISGARPGDEVGPGRAKTARGLTFRIAQALRAVRARRAICTK